MTKYKKYAPVILVFFLSLIIVFVFPSASVGLQINDSNLSNEVANSLLQQKVTNTLNQPKTITKIYDKTQLIGIVDDPGDLKTLLHNEYVAQYQQDFPKTELGFNEDIFTTTELSYFTYENKDQEIFDYIQKNDKFAVLTNKVVFSNGAVIFVNNVDDFNDAKKTFLLNFVSQTSYDLFMNKKTTPELTSFGYRDVALKVAETVEITKGYAPKDQIYMDKNSIVYYLSYGTKQTGDRANETWYTVVAGDTITGIAWLNNITVDQLMSTNSDVLFSQDQVLQPGLQLNVTAFSSPLNVSVSRERLYEDIVQPDSPQYVPDSSLNKGQTVVRVQEQTGTKNVKRLEVYLNGRLTDASVIISEVVTKPAVQGIIAYGTYEPPKVGTGTFRVPVDNANMTCNMFCYAGHRGVDWQNRYQHYGAPIYAGDTGVIIASGWSGGFGNRVIIDHGNGIQTLYAHMMQQPSVSVGQTVQKGQVIGYVGATGNVTGPHVHVEVYVRGVLTNPCAGYFPC